MKWIVSMMLFMAAIVPATANDAPRHALVIGNAAYEHFGVLANPANDARDMARTLRRLGFEVTELVDATFAQMDEAVFEFGETLAREGGVGLFYYAGHGIEAGGVNYLAPVDQEICAERELRRKAISVSAALAEMEYARNGTNIIILDACRDNPLPADARSSGSSRGLSVVQAPSGSLVVYATSPGEAAADGRGRNGVFTGALLSHISTPGIDVMDMLRDVRRDVMAATGNEQTPWENSSLTTRFYFAGAPEGGVAAQPVGPRLQVVPTYGEIEISVLAAGDLYLDGERLSRLDAGQTARLQDVLTGTRELAMDYGEERETLNVTVRSGAAASAPFQYEPAPPEPSLSLDTVMVEGGTFRMGSASGDDDERPVHTVTVNGFRMSETEVTVGQFRAFVRATGYETSAETEGVGGGAIVWTGSDFEYRADADWENPYFEQSEDHPVVIVSWYDAVAYANWLTEQDGLEPVYRISGTNVTWNRSANGWRLPTEAEWEYAARGGQAARDTTYAGTSSDATLDEYANIADRNSDYSWSDDNLDDGYEDTAPVASFRANELGLYDMSGNVFEWCWDRYDRDYYADSPAHNAAGPASGSGRVLRGGSNSDSVSYVRVANRVYDFPGYGYGNLGFRLVVPAP